MPEPDFTDGISGPALVPYLSVAGAASAIEFYERAFGAEVTVGPLVMPGGLIAHAELQIGDAAIMLADGGVPAELVATPSDVGQTIVQLMLYVDDADAVTATAIAAGADWVRPLADDFDGRRSAKIRDPYGHTWFISTRSSRSNDEVNKLLKEQFG